MDYPTIRRYVDGDEEKILELLSIVFGGWRGKDYWHWKYRGNPAGFYSNIWIAEHENRVVSYYAIIPVKLRIADKIVLGAQSVDTATHPDYRKLGLFSLLAKNTLTTAFKDGILIVYGFPGRMSYGGFLKTEWKDTGFVPKRYKILKIRKALNLAEYWNLLIKMNPRKAKALTSMFWRALRKRNLTSDEIPRISTVRDTLLLVAILISNFRALRSTSRVKEMPGLEIMPVDTFDEQIDHFWQESAPNFPVAIDRNKDYLNWRYFENPLDKYTVFTARKSNRIVGYMVLKIKKQEGIIMDILGRDEQTFTLLLQRAVQHFTSEGMATIQIWMPDNHVCARVIKRYGFGSYQWLARFSSRLGFLKGVINPFILYLNSPEMLKNKDGICNIEQWLLSAGDSDLF